MTNLTFKKRTARKTHQCGFCLCDIEKGNVYDYQTNAHGGNISSWKSHQECTSLLEYLEYDEDYGLSSCEFKEHVENFKEYDSNKTMRENAKSLFLYHHCKAFGLDQEPIGRFLRPNNKKAKIIEINNPKWKAMVKEFHEEYIEKTREYYKRNGELIKLEKFEKEIKENN